MEVFTNEASAKLDGDITDSVTTLTIKDPISVPATGTFRIRIDDELIKVTSTASLVWTIVRGDDGTTPIAHLDNAIIYIVVTKSSVDSLVSIQSSGSEVSNRRILNFIGATVADNSGNSRCDITLSSKRFEADWTTPIDANFVWLNQGTGSRVVNPNGSIYMLSPANASIASRGYMIACPATPYIITARLAFGILDVGSACAGLAWGDNVGSKLHSLHRFSPFIQVNRLTYTAFSSNDASVSMGIASNDFNWMQLEDNGTNRIFRVGIDGFNWIQIFSTGRTTHLTPTHVGLYLDSHNATWPTGVNLHSFAIT